MGEDRVRTTILDVALEAGVSRTTVSMALNNKGRVDPATRERIRQIAKQLDYRPSIRAQRLRTGRSLTVALLNALPFDSLGNAVQIEFVLELALPFAQASLERGYALLLIPPLSDSAQLSAYDIDGAVVLDPSDCDPFCISLKSRGLKVVTIGKADQAEEDGFVDRGYAGADVIIEHLLSQGCRHITVILSEEPHTTSTAVRRYLRKVSPPPGTEIGIETAKASDGRHGAYEVARRLISDDHALTDAIYAPLDTFAIAILEAARDLGVVVPRDLLVATNYDSRKAATAKPPLTTLDLDFRQLARQASTLLLDLLNGVPGSKSMEAPRPRLIGRESTSRRSSNSSTVHE